MNMVRPLPILSMILLLGGCATGTPVAVEHVIAVPERWSAEVPSSSPSADTDWWSGFDNDELVRFVVLARDQGYDVAGAQARVRQALAEVRIAGGQLVPEVSGSGDTGRTGPFGDGGTSSFDLGVTARYELDLWARNRAARQSALAALDAAGHDRDAVTLIAQTQTASAWAATVAATERHAIATRNLDAARRILALVESRQRAGMATPLELAQQRGLVASLEQRLAAIDRERAAAHATLAALIGQPPQGLMVETAQLSAVPVPALSPALPSTMLVHRPDIAAAERRLAAGGADVAVARAAMLPRITLGIGAGFESGRLSRLFDDPFYSLASALAAPIFAGGRLAGERDRAIARQEELLALYRRAIVTAFAEVEQALATIYTLDRERAAQGEVLAQAEIAARLAESRYRAGAETLLVMLDAQRTLYTAQEDALTLRHARMDAALMLYRSLGGSR